MEIEERSGLGSRVAAVIDQGLFAAGNFAVNVALARWLMPREYGAFALAYAVMLLAGFMQTALVIEPMLVFGAGRFASRRASYLRWLVGGHFVVTGAAAVVALLGAAIAASLGRTLLAVSLVTMAFAMPFALLPWLARRVFYLNGRVSLAAMGGAAYLSGVLAGLTLLSSTTRLSAPGAFLMLALAGGLTGWALLTVAIKAEPAEDTGHAGLALAHWQYGRWALGATALSWVPINIYYFVLGNSALEDTAELKVLMNLLMLVIHAASALSLVALPRLSEHAAHAEYGRFIRESRKLLLLVVLLGGGFVIAMPLFGDSALGLLFGDEYSGLARHSVLLGAVGILTALSLGLRSVLRAIERSEQVFHAYAVGSLLALVPGIPIALNYRVAGALVGTMIATLATVVALALSVSHTLNGMRHRLEAGKGHVHSDAHAGGRVGAQVRVVTDFHSSTALRKELVDRAAAHLLSDSSYEAIDLCGTSGPVRRLGLLLRCNAYLVGGDRLQDGSTGVGTLIALLCRTVLVRLSGGRVLLLGAGWPSSGHPARAILLGKLARGANLVWAVDAPSARILASTAPEAEHCPPAEFCLPTDLDPPAWSQRRDLAVWLPRSEQEYRGYRVADIAAIARVFTAMTQARVVFIAESLHGEDVRREIVSRHPELWDRISAAKVTSTEDAIREIAGSSLVMTLDPVGVGLALSLRRPVMPIAGDANFACFEGLPAEFMGFSLCDLGTSAGRRDVVSALLRRWRSGRDIQLHVGRTLAQLSERSARNRSIVSVAIARSASDN